jgi:hypothetical protein
MIICKGKPLYSGINLPHYHMVHHKSHRSVLEANLILRNENRETKRRSYKTALFS